MNGDMGDMHDGYCYHCGKGYCMDVGPGGQMCYGCGQCVEKPEKKDTSRQVTDKEVEAMLNGGPLYLPAATQEEVKREFVNDMKNFHGIDVSNMPIDLFEAREKIEYEEVVGSPSSGNSHTFMGIERVLTKLEEQAIFMIFSGQTTELRMRQLLRPSDPDENGW